MSSDNSEKKIKVALIQCICPHYRVPLFRKLSERMDLTLFYGRGETKGSWQNAREISGFDHRQLLTLKVGFSLKDHPVRLVWFPGLFFQLWRMKPQAVISEGDKISGFRVRQSISATWIGERGRGYFVQGIWIDREITKFLSKLFIPAGKRMYPYYPFTCRHRAICLSLVRPEAEERKSEVPKLHRASTFLEPHMRTIEEALQGNDFSENLDAFKSLKERVPPEWDTAWDSVALRMYLNDRDMKEYQLEDKA